MPSSSGLPGQYPYTRGIQTSGYRSRFWTMRQYAGYGSAAETNHRFKYLLANGQTGLSVAFDLPTQMGMDSDHPLALGEVGKVGVAVDTLDDMETLLTGIPLGSVSISMTINATAAILLAMVATIAKRQGIAGSALHGTVQNLSLIHISEPTRLLSISYAVFCLNKKTSHNATPGPNYKLAKTTSHASS